MNSRWFSTGLGFEISVWGTWSSWGATRKNDDVSIFSTIKFQDLPKLQSSVIGFWHWKNIIIRTAWLRKIAAAMESESEHFASTGPIEKIRAYFDSVTQFELDVVNTSHCELKPLGDNWVCFFWCATYLRLWPRKMWGSIWQKFSRTKRRWKTFDPQNSKWHLP